MAFPKNVEKWRSIVAGEIARGGLPFPPELILSLIRFESAGKAGAVNPRSGASGLMQVMGIALREYNRHHKEKLSMNDMRGHSPEAARRQIRVGLWILGDFWRKAYKYLIKKLPHVPVDDLVTISDMFYAAGPGKIRPKLDKLARADFAHFKAAHPTHKATLHASNVWGLTDDNKPAWDLSLIDRFVTGTQGGDIIPKPAKEGFLLALLLVAVVWYFFQAKKGVNHE